MSSTSKPFHEVQVRQTTPSFRSFRYQSTNIIDGQDYGVVGDGVADDTVQIQNALDDAYTWNDQAARDVDHPVDLNGGSNVVRLVGVFKITNTITIKSHVDFSRASFRVYGNPSTAIKVEFPNKAIVDRRTMYLPEVINMVVATPATAVGTAIQIQNAQNCRFTFRKVEGWNRGIFIIGDGDGVAWNQFYMDLVLNCKVAVELNIANSGYVNENQFYGGDLIISSGSNLSGHRYLKIAGDTSPVSVNNNTFFGMSFEGDAPEYHIVNGGKFITIFAPRFETSLAPPRILYSNPGGVSQGGGCDNIIFAGFPPIVGGSVPTVTTSGAHAGERCVMMLHNPSAANGAGFTLYGPVAMGRDPNDFTRPTLFLDDTNHKIGIGTGTPTQALSVRSPDSSKSNNGINISLNDYNHIGSTASQLGTLIGYNAKASDDVNTSNGVKSASADTFYTMIRQSQADNGTAIFAYTGAMSAGDALPKSGADMIMKFTPTGPVINTLPAFSAGSKYLVLDGSGNVRLSATGPNS